MSQPKARTIFALLAVVAAVAVAYLASVVVVARHTDKPQPELAAYSHGKTVTVNPYMYCDLNVADRKLDLTDCKNTQAVSELDIPLGSPLQISLPKDIANVPWELLVGYRLPDNTIEPESISRPKDKPYAYTLNPKPGKRIAVVELHLPIPARDAAGNEGFISRGVWSIHTPAFDPALFS
ncbi:DUF2771 family protein [Nocardia sp. NBC_00511]|uniref:DUF2771 family protein n=1 Tax=Nocardia sp. NBC_00511 TaxID=2903591 RepID=UPI0030DF0FF7